VGAEARAVWRQQADERRTVRTAPLREVPDARPPGRPPVHPPGAAARQKLVARMARSPVEWAEARSAEEQQAAEERPAAEE
jgi:hypothetical protein